MHMGACIIIQIKKSACFMVGQNLLKDPDMYCYIYEVSALAALKEIMHLVVFLIHESGLLVLVGSSLD